jgi:cellulose synthase/poly-beta-1,6-N-acetylglucosamine synthase-like glycosyltransferase
MTLLHYWPALVGSLLSLITLPGTFELGLLTFAGMLPFSPRRKRRHATGPLVRKLAVVVPAHDEEILITRCVRSIGACEVPSATERVIVVIADNCSDRTAKMARSAGARVIERVDAERRGKGYTLQYTFEKLLAEGFDAVLVMDADSQLDTNALIVVVGLLEAGAEAVQIRYLVLNAERSLRTRLMNIALMAFNHLRARARERLGLSVGIFGNGFALSRATLLTAPYDTHSVAEDLEYHVRLVRTGPIVEFAESSTVRGEIPRKESAARSQRARWEGGRLRVALDNMPYLLRGVLSGNWRQLEPFLELSLLPLAYHILLLCLTLATPFEPARIYAGVALAVVVVHVCAGIVVGGGGLGDFAALVTAPLYIAWKLSASTAILKAAGRTAPWTRTPRD